jgi:hypothetical protein
MFLVLSEGSTADVSNCMDPVCNSGRERASHVGEGESTRVIDHGGIRTRRDQFKEAGAKEKQMSGII